MDLGGESQAKEPRRVPKNFPHQIPKSKVPKSPQENNQERAPKITTKNNRKQHNKALRNHAESSIHTKKVHTRYSLPPDHPTLSQDFAMKLSS
jgi:DNA anti-recombination protein RmuC